MRASRPEEMNAKAGIFGKIESRRCGEAPKIINARQGIQGKSGDVLAAAKEALNSRFANMRKAFRFIDVDNSGTVSREEVGSLRRTVGLP